jgi:two-component system response regulator YesN
MRLSEYIESVRIAKAQALLRTTNRSVLDTAALVGYRDANYFSKVFRKNIGVSPSQFQRETRAERQSD